MARKFKGILFYGCGDDRGIAKSEKRLHRLLNKALNLVGGLQQPAHPDSKEGWIMACEQYRKGWRKVEDVVRDVAMALTGQEIEFVGKTSSERWDEALKRAREE